MNIDKFREVIKQREYAEEISHGEWDDEFERCWKEEINILSEDVNSTISFLNNECTGEEYIWISEIIDDLAEKTQSKALVKCYKSLMDKFPDACKQCNIAGSLEYAENALGDSDGQEA